MIDPETTLRESGNQKSLTPGNYTVKLKTISGFVPPSDQPVPVNGGQLTTLPYTYQVLTPLDTWRFGNFGTYSKTGDAADGADPDKDGQNNLSEFAADTNPNNASDAFKILTVTKSATTFTVNAAGKTARSYILERSITLSPNQWSAVASFGPLAGNGPVALTDPAAPAGSAFYRLRVTAP